MRSDPAAEPAPQRLTTPRIALVLAVLAVVFSLPALRGSGRELDYLANFSRFAARFWPPDFSVFPTLLPALFETFQIAVLATLFASLLAIPIALAAAENISPKPLVVAARLLLNTIRAIPGLIWALLAVAVVGANPLAGIMALSIYSLGYLGKFFSDAYESVDRGVAQALDAVGAGMVQRFQYGIWPHAKPHASSQILWMLEYNIRSAAIIGYVGAGGIGVWLHTYQEFYQWDRFATALLCILAVVLVLDFAGVRVRRYFSATRGG